MSNARIVVCLFLLLDLPILLRAQGPATLPSTKPDYSQEAAVIQEYSQKVKFENDGTAIQEEYAKVRVQSDAGVQRYGLLTFSYASGTGSYEIQFIRVTKPDGSIVETTTDSIQDMPAEITRQAPFYSDLRQKHAAVKGLGIGDVLEYKTVAHVNKPLAPGQFWFDYADSYDEASNRYRGLRAGQNISLSEGNLNGLLVKPDVAHAQIEASTAPSPDKPVPPAGDRPQPQPTNGGGGQEIGTHEPSAPAKPPLPKRYHGSVSLDPNRVGRDAGRIADEVISHLVGQVGADVKVTLEIQATIPSGVPDNVIRIVTENGRTLKFTSHGFEED